MEEYSPFDRRPPGDISRTRAARHGLMNLDIISNLWYNIAVTREQAGDTEGAKEAYQKSRWYNPAWRRGQLR